MPAAVAPFEQDCAAVSGIVARSAAGAVVVLALVCVGGAQGQDEAPEPDADSPAQETAPAEPPVVVPPRLEEILVLPYPEDAPRGDGMVEVRIKLAIDDTGAFVAAEVEGSAGEPFDGLALDTVRHCRFSPALVDGIPAAVTIVVPVRFVLPSPRPPAPDAGVLVGKVREAGTRRFLQEAQLTLEPAEGSDPTGPVPSGVVTDREGGFRFIDVPVGTWTVTVSGPKIQTATFTETIEEDLLRQVVYKVMPRHTESRTVVRSRRRPASGAERIVEGEWIRSSAGSSGGYLRILESEAPVAPTPVLPAGLLPGAPMIRGMEGSDSVVLIDGVETPLLYHFGLLTTVVATDLVDYVRLHPGGAGVEVGDHIGGVVDVALRPPRNDSFGGVIDVSPIDVMAIFETPFGKPVSGFAAVRRSYIDLYLGKVLPDDMPAEVTAMPVYADVSGMINIEPGRGHRVAVSVIASSDKMEMAQAGTAGSTVLGALEAGFARVHGFWRSPSTGTVDGRASVAYEYFKSRYSAFPDLYLDAREKRVQLDGAVGIRLGEKAHVRMGVDYRHRIIMYEENFFALPREDEPGLINPYATAPDFVTQETPMDDVGAWISLPATPSQDLKLTPGIRANFWNAGDEAAAVIQEVPTTRVTLDPRMTARYRANERWRFDGSVGVYHQVPSLEDLVQAGSSALRPEAAVRGSVATTWSPIPAIDLGLDLYVAGLWNLVVADTGLYDAALQGSLYEGEAGDVQLLSNSGIGVSSGAELTLRWHPDSHVDCMVAYSLSRSVRRDHEDEPWRVYQYDRPHQLTFAGQVHLPHEWSFGLRFRLTSGAPDTPITDVVYLADLGGYAPQWGLPYSTRMRPFHQLDWRVQKVFRARSFMVVVYLDVENTYFAQRDDVTFYNRDFSERMTFAMIPLLRLGVRTEF